MGVRNMSATKWPKSFGPNETDISETRGLVLKLIWVSRLKHSLDRYVWDAKPTENFHRNFWSWRSLKCVKSKFKNKILNGVSVISVQVRAEVSQSYQCQRWVSRLSHIGPNSDSSVSLISVSTVNHASHSYRSQLDRFGAVILGTPSIVLKH